MSRFQDTVVPTNPPKGHPDHDPFVDGSPKFPPRTGNEKSRPMRPLKTRLITFDDLIPLEQRSREEMEKYLSKSERNKRTKTSFHAARTKKHFEDFGYTIERCEFYKMFPGGGVYMDLFGFADFMAYHKDKAGVIAVQQIGRSNLSAHIRKFCAEDRIADWLYQPSRRLVFIWWHQEKKGGKWTPYLTELTLEIVQFKQDPSSKNKRLPPFTIGVEL